jgi:hypothetical protein
MIKAYGNYTLTFAIASSGGGAAFLSSSTVMNDGRSGIVCSMTWDTGAQTTSTTVTITVTISDPLDATAPIGVVGLCNVTGLPAGLQCTVNGVVQTLTKGARDELCAWWLPSMSASNTLQIVLKNNDGAGGHPVLAGATFGIGEIFVGRALAVPTLVNAGTQQQSDLQDPTAYQRSNGGQLWQVMRKPFRQISSTLGPFTAADCFGKSGSSISSGGNPAGKIDVVTLRDYISTSRVIAVCDAPSAGSGAGTLVNGIRYDQSFMQANWMLARPVAIGQIVRNMDPLYTWSPQYQEAI